jgi:peptidoglycan hydrolase CwlO-like protein
VADTIQLVEANVNDITEWRLYVNQEIKSRYSTQKIMTENDIAILMNLIQRLQKEADELKAEIEILKKQIEKYESNIRI